jgi:predicted transcriptional regulator
MIAATIIAFFQVLGPLEDQPVRRRLLGLIRKQPGIHASELARGMEESWGTVQYHLNLLRKADLVQSVEAGRERRFFPEGVAESKMRLMTVLTQGRRGEIAQFIHSNPGARQVDICNALEVSRKTFRSSIQPMVEEGLVHEQKGLHNNRYFSEDSLDSALALSSDSVFSNL